MGQSSSQQYQAGSSPPPAEVKRPAPPRPSNPPQLQVKPVPRAPSYAVPENKVLPTELPSKPLKAVSSPHAKSDPEFEQLFGGDKENNPTELNNGGITLEQSHFTDISDKDLDEDVAIYQAEQLSNGDATSLDPALNRAALAHRRTISLDRLPVRRGNGYPRRPVSAVNLMTSEHTIFEDPEESLHSSKSSLADQFITGSLPQKSTFPMDYSYAVTYAQLAGHRRKELQNKLSTEKDILQKQQSLPDKLDSKKIDGNGDMLLMDGYSGEIDLDNYTPKKKKYRAPLPPSHIMQVSQSSIVLNNNTQNKGHSTPREVKKGVPQEEPPADYDTGESPSSPVYMIVHKETPTMSIDNVKYIPIPFYQVETKATSSKVEKGTETQISGLHLDRNNRVFKSSSPVVLEKNTAPDLATTITPAAPPATYPPTSPKSPPPPVAPKPLKSLAEENFMFPMTSSRTTNTDVVTVNGQVIPEVPLTNGLQDKEVLSISIDSNCERVAAAVYTPPTAPPVPKVITITPTHPVADCSPVRTNNVVITDLTHTPHSLDQSMSTSSADSAKSESPLLTPTERTTPKMNSLLQHDIMTAAEVRVLNLKKPATPTIKPKTQEEVFKEQLTKIHKQREERFNKSTSVEEQSVSLQNLESTLEENNTSMQQHTISMQHDLPTEKQNPPVEKKELAIEQQNISMEEAIILLPEEDDLGKEVSSEEVSPDSVMSSEKDNDSGIQACSLSEDWTPKHDLLEDSEDEHRSSHTSRSTTYYDAVKSPPATTPAKTDIRATNSHGSIDHQTKSSTLASRKIDLELNEKNKFGSLRRFKHNLHKGVKNAFSSGNKSSSKSNKSEKIEKHEHKHDKRSSWSEGVVSKSKSSERDRPVSVFRKLDPDSVEPKDFPNGGDHVDDAKVNGKKESSDNEHKLERDRAMEEVLSDDSSHVQVMRRAGVAYVSGKGQIVLLPDFDTLKSDGRTPSGEDTHRAPKRWKKLKKFSYMATTRKKEKDRMEKVLQERVAEQEQRMETERQKQLEMEQEFRKVRQIDSLNKKEKSLEIAPSHNVASNRSSINDVCQDHAIVHMNGNTSTHGQIAVSGISAQTATTSLTMPTLVPAANLLSTAGQTSINPALLSTPQPLNPWLQNPPLQTMAYPTAMSLGMTNYGTLPSQLQTPTIPYDLANYMRMLDINAQTIHGMQMNAAGGMNSYNNWGTQSLDRNATNVGLIQYNNGVTPTSYNGMANTIPVNQIHLPVQTVDSLDNIGQKRSLKQTIYVNPGVIDDSLLNQMYAEYDHGTRNQQFSSEGPDKKKRSNPLYFSSDEEEEYDMRDVHSGRVRSKGAIARISVPDNHFLQNGTNDRHHNGQYRDEDMPSPRSVTSSSADTGTPPSSAKIYFPVGIKSNGSSYFIRSESLSDPMNLDDSYSSADR